MFSGNPECLELNELVKQAEEAISKGQYDKSLSLSNAAIQSCENVVISKGKKINIPKNNKLPTSVIISFESIAFIGAAYGMYYYYKKRKLRNRG